MNSEKIKMKNGIYQNTKLWNFQSGVEAHRLLVKVSRDN